MHFQADKCSDPLPTEPHFTLLGSDNSCRVDLLPIPHGCPYHSHQASRAWASLSSSLSLVFNSLQQAAFLCSQTPFSLCLSSDTQCWAHASCEKPLFCLDSTHLYFKWGLSSSGMSSSPCSDSNTYARLLPHVDDLLILQGLAFSMLACLLCRYLLPLHGLQYPLSVSIIPLSHCIKL